MITQIHHCLRTNSNADQFEDEEYNLLKKIYELGMHPLKEIMVQQIYSSKIPLETKNINTACPTTRIQIKINVIPTISEKM
ncbi:MAG: hypothetical protein V8S31_00625 [Lachnospiraceae bacterium]